MATLSLRLRIPIDISIAVLVTGVALAGTVLWNDYQTLLRDLDGSTARLAETIALALEPELRVADRWSAYLTLRALYEGMEPSWLSPTYVLVLDRGGRTLVTSAPTRFPVALAPGLGFDPGSAAAEPHHAGSSTRTLIADGYVYGIRPLGSSEGSLGTLILAFSKQNLWPRFRQNFIRVLFATGAVLLLLLPVGWWLGWRVAAPLRELEGCVARLADARDLPLTCRLGEEHDELGRLGLRIEQVAHELQVKRELEARMVQADRQAALGRLAAGVAHEINNPLAGMVTAIATQRRHPDRTDFNDQTLALIERGLQQIRHVVSALLVEVKAKPRPLAPQDIDDIAELIAPQARARTLDLVWHNRLTTDLALPADTVRQILLNLALNAVAAAPAGGRVEVTAAQSTGALLLGVGNTGPRIPAERLAHLFEPFSDSTSGGSGLGLWVTDQAVRQLRGEIHVESGPAGTRFEVTLPCEEHS